MRTYIIKTDVLEMAETCSRKFRAYASACRHFKTTTIIIRTYERVSYRNHTSERFATVSPRTSSVSCFRVNEKSVRNVWGARRRRRSNFFSAKNPYRSLRDTVSIAFVSATRRRSGNTHTYLQASGNDAPYSSYNYCAS